MKPNCTKMLFCLLVACFISLAGHAQTDYETIIINTIIEEERSVNFGNIGWSANYWAGLMDANGKFSDTFMPIAPLHWLYL